MPAGSPEGEWKPVEAKMSAKNQSGNMIVRTDYCADLGNVFFERLFITDVINVSDSEAFFWAQFSMI